MSPIILLIIVAVLGYGSGLSAEMLIEGEMSKVQQVILNSGIEFQSFSLIKSAELSSSIQSIIDSASIGFVVGPVLQDPDEMPDTGDEFFLNQVNECKFHSDDTINGATLLKQTYDDGVCVVCKILKEMEPCVDVWLDFVNLPDESTESDINNALAAQGITVSANAFSNNDPDTVIIFDSDIAHGTDDKDLESPVSGGGAQCSGCTGFHIVIIPEGTGNPPVAKSPADDSSVGGVQTWKFDPPRFVNTFDFVDKDSGPAGVAKAYVNYDCTGLIDTVIIPNVGEGSVQTVNMNANNVSCLKIEYNDSGGVTNMDLECVHMVLGEGQLDLPTGYTASDTISIPIDDVVNVGWAGGIQFEVKTVILDFEDIPTGQTLSDQYLADYGIDIEGFACSNSSCSTLVPLGPQVFNTNANNTPDPDLEVDVGKIAIVPHDDNNNGVPDLPPDDSPDGGDQYYKFSPKRYVNSLLFIDADRGSFNTDIGDVIAYRDLACTDQIKKVDILSKGDGSKQVLVMMNAEQVSCLKVSYRDSGGVSSLNLGCPLPDDP